MNPKWRRIFVISLLMMVLAAFAGPASPVVAQNGEGPSLIKENGKPTSGEPIDQLISMVNDQLELRRAPYRLGGVWMFTIGAGRPANRRLQRGTRWVPADPRRAAQSTGTKDITYVVDASDLTTDVPTVDAEAAVDASFDTWSNVPNTFLDLAKAADDGLNHDLLDNIPADTSLCTFPGIVDIAALDPNADVIVGGWLPRGYFDCLTPGGGNFILGVTWTFIFFGPSGPTDVNNDGYVDTALKEIYYNEAFLWVTSGSFFLGPFIDIESVSLHENGHAVDLGHFGGPPPPLKIHPGGRIFSPEAVMNPAYIGGDIRELFPIDEAGYYTLYAKGKGRVK